MQTLKFKKDSKKIAMKKQSFKLRYVLKLKKFPLAPRAEGQLILKCLF